MRRFWMRNDKNRTIFRLIIYTLEKQRNERICWKEINQMRPIEKETLFGHFCGYLFQANLNETWIVAFYSFFHSNSNQVQILHMVNITWCV